MGLDQYAGLRDSRGEVHEKFYWRKHARLQVFMANQFNKQKKDQDHNTHDNLQHLGFNGGQGGVTITEDLINDLEEAIRNDYYDYFASDGFFWGQQFQEEQVKEYKEKDKGYYPSYINGVSPSDMDDVEDVIYEVRLKGKKEGKERRKKERGS